MNFRVPYNAGNFLISWGSGSFLGIILFRLVSYKLIQRNDSYVLSLVKLLSLLCTTRVSGGGVWKYTWLFFGHFILSLRS
jgi:hypothetical protein